MASRDPEMMVDDETITRGTDNVFADLGYADADERQTKLRLANAINRVVVRRRLTQALLLKSCISISRKYRRWRITSSTASWSNGR